MPWSCSRACSSQSANDDGLQAQASFVPLSCIAVLPASTSVDKDETINYEKAQAPRKGSCLCHRGHAAAAAGQTKGTHRKRTSSWRRYGPDISGGISGTVAALGQKLNCDGVLLTTVRQYRQRQGTEYSADAPAAVDFFMVLRHSTDGNILWSADFREEQQSVLSNIFSFSKAKSRGFKWVTVEQLMEQGIKERLEELPVPAIAPVFSYKPAACEITCRRLCHFHLPIICSHVTRLAHSP